MGLLDRLMTAARAFQEAWLNADAYRAKTSMGDWDAFSQWEGRQQRYELFWSMYQSNTFQEGLHRWAALLKLRRGLYRHTRSLFSPGKRLGDFWADHLHGGRLDPDAGNGDQIPTAIPIQTENEKIREGIGRLWRDSQWQKKKETYNLYGSIKGDVGLQAYDDSVTGRVILRVVHPSTIKWLDRDPVTGLTRGYILEEMRYTPEGRDISRQNIVVNPQSMRRTVIYNEEGWIDDNGVVHYRTYSNYAEYNWRGQDEGGEDLPTHWTVDYPFIPFVVVQHQEIGGDWGMSELHCMLSKVFEADDMGSGLGDQIRKAIRAPHAITGMAKPKSDAGVTTIDGLAPTQGNPEADRQEMPILWLPNADARVHQLTFDLHVGDVGAHIDRLREVIEEDYPELQDDIWSIKATSGRALKIARERVEAKVHRRRPSYDAALAQIQKMALAMGGMQGYDGYEGYGLDAYESGALDHEIGHRPVFGVDPIDDIEEEQARSQALATSTKAGIPLVIAMKRLGYTEEEIAASQAQAVLNAQVQTQAAQQGLPGAKPPATIPLDPTSGESGKGITTDAAKETAARTSSERPKGAY